MMEEEAIVVAVDAGGIWVESDRTGACQSCSASKGCGQRALAEYASKRSERLLIDNPHGLVARVGDRVRVGIEEGSFLQASILLYTLPLVLLFLGGYLGSFYGTSELPSVVASFAGLAAGLWLARSAGQRLARSCRYQPVLMNII
ncbi:SoxR reducing system RseC family protein [Marinobacterium rhizophilum]|uniref:SoxR reducing system RseC family protein n=1 Tax=Marinobacterium rhizophilum TaxID=420402 RepID=UPI00037CEFA8|nr:SoxR reducing system RseC family protein [Marinobacterium rhizophilum]